MSRSIFLTSVLGLLAAPALEAQHCAPAAIAVMAADNETADREARAAIATAARMDTDWERCRSLAQALRHTRAVETAKAFFEATRMITGDYEVAELLIAAATRGLVEDRTQEAFFAALARLESDFERRRALTPLVRARGVTPSTLAGVLRAASAIESDYEAASLLVDVAGYHALGGELRDLYVAAARGLQTDWEYHRALQALSSPRRSGSQR